MMLDPKSICIKPSATTPESYALSFTGKSECDCAIKVYAAGWFSYFQLSLCYRDIIFHRIHGTDRSNT